MQSSAKRGREKKKGGTGQLGEGGKRTRRGRGVRKKNEISL